MNSILDELYNLLNEADESFGLNEKITTKQALRRKRRAIKKAKQKAAKKQAQQTDTQDQTKYLPATIEHLIKPDEKQLLITAALEIDFKELGGNSHSEALIEIGKILQIGAEKYTPNNWRLIPQEEHLNHALIHYIAYLASDTQDNHLQHCMCRLMMAYATERTKGFYYTKPLGVSA